MSPSHIPTVFDADKYSTKEQRAEFAAALRAMAAWVETTEFPIHRYCMGTDAASPFQFVECSSTWYTEDPDFVTRVASAARLMGGKVGKGTDFMKNFTLTKDFGSGVRFVYKISREAVCTAEEVPKAVDKEIPVDAARAAELEAQMAALQEQMDGLETHTVQDVELVTEFKCPPSLLSAEATA